MLQGLMWFKGRKIRGIMKFLRKIGKSGQEVDKKE